jgi:PPOX class probable F420-dependent enzyme
MSVFPDPATDYGARVQRRLQSDKVIWLTTVGVDGTPQPNPVWFLWQDDGILVYNRPAAHRLTHLRERPRVALNLNSDGNGGDIVVLTGTAGLLPDHPGPHQDEQYLRKYGVDMARISGDVEQFGAAYSIAVRIAVDRVRGF